MPIQSYQVLLPPFEFYEGEGDQRKLTRIEADQQGTTIQLDSDLTSVQSLVKVGVIASVESPVVAVPLSLPAPISRGEQLKEIYKKEGFKALAAIADSLGVAKRAEGWEATIPDIVAAEQLAAETSP